MDEQNMNQQNMNQSMQQQHMTYNTPEHNPQTAVMTTKEWVVTYLIMMIPCIGWIMAIVWAFSDSGNLNRRNYCRAFLIVLGILIALYVVLWVIIGAAMIASFGF